METHGISQPLGASEAASFRMIDIGEKKDTQRRAIASGIFFARMETILRIKERSLPKGDVLVLAEAAGIQGAKLTSTLLPLCHPLSLTSVRVWTELSEKDQVKVFCEVKTIGKTGVEMEALSGVNAALLCLYDLTKGIDPVLGIGSIRLELKEGGKSGVWRHPEGVVSHASSPIGVREESENEARSLQGIKAAVITLSDRCFKREAEDLSGPLAYNWLSSRGAIVENTAILPDEAEPLKRELKQLIEAKGVRLIITSGGTGISVRDITPETVLSLSRELNGKEVLGIGEFLRQSGAQYTQKSWLSRSCAFLIQGTLILCLPGSPAAVKESLVHAGGLLSHCLHVARGGGHS